MRTALTLLSPYPHPTLPLPPQLQLYPRPQQYHEITLHAPLHPLHHVGSWLHSGSSLYPLYEHRRSCKTAIQLVWCPRSRILG